jgi:hypothetical protein
MILVTEAAEMGIQWLALGGGEPTEWDGLVELVDLAKEAGLRVAVTTNGTYLLPLNADRVHISHDTMHRTSRQAVLNAADFYQSRGAEVGLNVIADDLDFVTGLPFQEVAQVVLLLPKPYKPDDVWLKGIGQVIDYVHQNRLTTILVDACLGRLLTGRHCMQGRSSMSLDQSGMASVCSNVSNKHLFTNRLYNTERRCRMKFPDRITFGDKYRPAMAITNQAEADEYLEACVEHCMRFGFTREEAEAIERGNLGYYAGYYDAGIRARVERLFKCAHPIFGAIAEVGIPSSKAAFDAGIAIAESLTQK